MPTIPAPRYTFEIRPGALDPPKVLVTVTFSLALEAKERLVDLAKKRFGTVESCCLGRMTGERTEELTVSFLRAHIANVFGFLATAEHILYWAERCLENGENVHGLKLYCFETVVSPPIYLALNPKLSGREASALLRSAEILEEDDSLDDMDLAEVSKAVAEGKTVDDSASLWETFLSKTEPCIVASGRVE